MSKAKFVSGPSQPRPSPSALADGPFERIVRLAFDLQEPNSLIPTIVTRDGPFAVEGPTAVPRQALTVVPLLNIAEACRQPSPPPPSPHASSHHLAQPRAPHPHVARPSLPPPPPRMDAAGISLPGYAPGYKDRNQDSALLLDTFLSNRQQLLA
ncbi:hypothetical protein Agub_g13320, partial [Astrephomene gubernaculifera]